MLTSLACSISSVWDYTTVLNYTTDRHEVMAQKAEKMLPKILNE